jgi:hypothetical protein
MGLGRVWENNPGKDVGVYEGQACGFKMEAVKSGFTSPVASNQHP